MCIPPTICSDRSLTFETMLSDPMIRLMMDSDGVTVRELVEVLSTARDAIVLRERAAVAQIEMV